MRQLHQRVQLHMRLLFLFRKCSHQKSFFLFSTSKLIKDRYYLPSKDLGNLSNVAMGVFNHHLLGNPQSKHKVLDYFIRNVGEVLSS